MVPVENTIALPAVFIVKNSRRYRSSLYSVQDRQVSLVDETRENLEEQKILHQMEISKE